MSAYSPRHAAGSVPRFPYPPSRTTRLRRALTRLILQVRQAVTVRPAWGPFLLEETAPAPARFPCCAHCTDGCPCDPVDNHPMACLDGCNDPAPSLAPTVLTDKEIAALTPRSRELPRPTYYGREDGAVVVGHGNKITIEPATTLPYLPASTLDWRTPLTGRAPYPVASTAELTRLPVYGQVCQVRADEAQRLAAVMQP